MNTPDITTAQIVGVVGAIVGLLIAYGVHVSTGQQHAIVQLVTVLPAVLFAADAWIRGKRTQVARAQLELETAAHHAAAPPPAGTQTAPLTAPLPSGQV